MQRYHKDVYFPDKDKLKAFNDRLNDKDFKYSSHTLDNLKHRVIDLENLLVFIKGLRLKELDIFEYYKDNDIQKACYRIDYELYDFILVMSKDKVIITIYINAKDDTHLTLDKSLYERMI